MRLNQVLYATVLCFGVTILFSSTESSLVSKATAAQKCGPRTFEVVKHGRMFKTGSKICIGGSAKAFKQGGKFALWSSSRPHRMEHFVGKRRGRTIYGTKMTVPRYSGPGSFTAKIKLTDNGRLIWHWVEKNRNFLGYVR